MGAADGLNPGLLSAFLRMQADAAKAGYNLGIGSGFRTPEAQAGLRIKNGCPDVYSSPASSCRVPTAIPGRSNHNHGLAIDLSGSNAAKAWANANGARYGLHFPVAGEDWHVELIGGGSGAGHVQGAQQMGAIGFDVNWMDTGQSPEEKQDSMIAGYMDAITGAQQDELLSAPSSDMLSTPMPEEVQTPELARSFGQNAPGSAAIRSQQVSLPGAPGAAPPAAGGQFQGGVPPAGYVPPGSGVERWRPIAIAALKYSGQNPTPDLVALMLRRMAQESGGDPRATNNWDSNAKRGDPSKGLMQNIGSAFPDRARELTNRGIYDGFANMVASIRYTLGRYGSLAKGWGRPGGY